jgi:hypothetical protein
MTTTVLHYGSYEHGRTRCFERCYVRDDTYVNAETGERSHSTVHAAHHGDDSPIWTGEYNPRCVCCYLGFGHTTEAHQAQR